MSVHQSEMAKRRAAKKIGVTFEEYQGLRAAGRRWCSAHRRWCAEADFPRKQPYCREGLRAKDRAYRERLWEEERNWLLARVLVK